MVAEANKYLSDQAPWKLKDDPSPDGHRPARRAAGGQRLQHAAHAVPAALRAEGPRAARRHRRARADAGDRARSTTSTAARRTRSSPATTPSARAGSRCRSWPARRWPRRSRCSASSTRRSSTRSWPGSPTERPTPRRRAPRRRARSHRVAGVHHLVVGHLGARRPGLVDAAFLTLRAGRDHGVRVRVAQAHPQPDRPPPAAPGTAPRRHWANRTRRATASTG